jgi:hypothetical protein
MEATNLVLEYNVVSGGERVWQTLFIINDKIF